ncbi:MAG: hypothetical protein HKL80_08195 [Acidimicrobiales bacterium]|nr:hypothetical protein [Acidimicrobiales bacterium]
MLKVVSSMSKSGVELVGIPGRKNRLIKVIKAIASLLITTTMLLGISTFLKAPYAKATGVAGGYQEVGAIPPLTQSISHVSCFYTTCVAVSYGQAASPTSYGVIYYSSNSGSTWSEAPTPVSTGMLFSVSCASVTTCVAVGNENAPVYGAAGLYSTDGGKTWTQGSGLASSNTLLSVSCYSATNCMAGTYDGVEATTNGGQTWLSTAALPAGAGSMEGISCYASSSCVAVGATNNYSAGFVVSTTNFGASWTLDTIPSGVSLMSVSCSSSGCVSVGGSPTNSSANAAAIYSSSPNTSWSSATIPTGLPGLSDISCENQTTCEAVGGNSTSGVAMETTDSGANWTNITAPPSSSGFNSISCESPSLCVGVGTLSSGAIFLDFSAGIDGTWIQASVPQGAFSLPVISCPTSTTCYAGGYTGANGPNIEVTNNGGATWSFQTLPQYSGITTISSISCASASDCVAVAGNTSTSIDYYTTNGGSSWSIGTVPSGVVVRNVSCPSTTSCYGVGYSGPSYYGAVIVSTDGGASWLISNLPSATLPTFTAIACPSTQNCVVAGGQSSTVAVIDSSDGGASWTQGSLPTNIFTISSVSCSTATICVMGGRSTANAAWIMYSTNEGASWSASTLPSGSFIAAQSFSCLSNSECHAFAYGVDFYVPAAMTSYDGGITWQSDTLPTNISNLYQISCSAPTSCYGFAVGTNGWWEDLSYMAAPTITSVSPSSGYTSGGAIVTINGTSFANNSTVYFGASKSSSVQFVSTSELKAVSPPGASGTINIAVVNSVGQSTPNGADQFTYVPGGTYVPVSPVRIADTRSGATDPATYAGQTLNAGHESFNVAVVNANGDQVPSNAMAVVANLTAVNPSTAGYLTAYPAGNAKPATSSLNFSAGEYAVANMIEIPLGVGGSNAGSITISNFMGATDVLVDVEGYVLPDSTGSTVGLFNPVTPFRIVDTRPGSTIPAVHVGSTFSPGQTENFTVTGTSGPSSSIPSTDVSAVVINVTATNTSSDGFVSVYPTPSTPLSAAPTFSSLNFLPNTSVPNRVIVPVGVSGQISVYVNQGADIVIDISGWFTGTSSGATGDLFFPVSPQRIADTRSGFGYNNAGQTLQGGSMPGLGAPDTVLTVGVNNDLVPTAATGLVANVTVTNTNSAGYLTVYPTGSSPPYTSDLNWSTGETVPNAVVVALGTNGELDVAANTTTDFIVDVTGFYAP